jgi:hypothetical protein
MGAQLDPSRPDSGFRQPPSIMQLLIRMVADLTALAARIAHFRPGWRKAPRSTWASDSRLRAASDEQDCQSTDVVGYTVCVRTQSSGPMELRTSALCVVRKLRPTLCEAFEA